MPNLEEEAARVASEVLKSAQSNGTRPALLNQPSIPHEPAHEDKSAEVTITLEEPTPKMPQSTKGGPVNYFEDQTSNDHIRRSMSSATITQGLNDYQIDSPTDGEAEEGI